MAAMARSVLALMLVGALGFAACGGDDTTVTEQQPAQKQPGGDLTGAGVGPVTQGQSPAAVRKSFGTPDEQRRVPGCELSGPQKPKLEFVWHLEGGTLTLQFDDKDRFSSYRTTSPELATESGSRVGDPFAGLRDSYGPTLRRLDVGAQSTPRAGFWYVGPSLDSAILFSIAGAKVRSIAGGKIEICE
jgi:hypothetical protein